MNKLLGHVHSVKVPKTALQVRLGVFYDRNRIGPHEDAVHLYAIDELVPRVVPDLRSFRPRLGVDVKYFLDHILALGRDEARYQIVAVEYFLIELACVRVFERQISADHGVEDDTQTPNVGLKSPVAPSRDHFGRRIARTAASCL